MKKKCTSHILKVYIFIWQHCFRSLRYFYWEPSNVTGRGSQGFRSFETRKINQDPLENYFGNVKSHDFRSNKPRCYQFEAIFKSLLLRNLTSKSSPGYNCEDDDGNVILSECNVLLSGTKYLLGENDDEIYVQMKSLINIRYMQALRK